MILRLQLDLTCVCLTHTCPIKNIPFFYIFTIVPVLDWYVNFTSIEQFMEKLFQKYVWESSYTHMHGMCKRKLVTVTLAGAGDDSKVRSTNQRQFYIKDSSIHEFTDLIEPPIKRTNRKKNKQLH